MNEDNFDFSNTSSHELNEQRAAIEKELDDKTLHPAERDALTEQLIEVNMELEGRAEKEDPRARIEEIELEIKLIGAPEMTQDLREELIGAGFVVREGEGIAPDWEADLGAKGLEGLSGPQLAALVDVAHRDLARRIDQDVERGLSVEEAYMSRAATDPAATLIAEATVARNLRAKTLQNELEELRIKADLERGAQGHAREIGESFAKQATSPNEVRGFEQVCRIVQKGIMARPDLAGAIRKEAETALKDKAVDWRDPAVAADKILNAAHTPQEAQAEKIIESQDLSRMSAKEFTALAAKEYVNMYEKTEKENHNPATASTVAIAHIKELANRAKLRISFREISDAELQKASKSPAAVEKLLTGKVKPPRTATMAKARTRDRDNDRS